MKKASGFTLVELIVASAIVALLLLGAYSVFHSGIISYRRIGLETDNYQRARIIFSRMETDLKNSFSFRADDSGFKGSLAAMHFWSVVDSYETDKKETDVCRIDYEAKDAGLKRTVYRGLGSMTGEDPLFALYAAANVEFHYGIASDNPQQPITWLDSWPKEGDEKTAKALPLAVRVEFTAGSEGGKFMRTIPLAGLISVPAGANE